MNRVVCLLLISTIPSILTQTCRSGASIGPCLATTDPNCAAQSGTCVVEAAEPSGFICCPTSQIIPATNNNNSISNNLTSCVDLKNPATGVSDCPRRAHLCTDTVYHDVMRVQCPKTCNLCNHSVTNSTTHQCRDLVNPSTGVSDCSKRSSLCNDAVYYDLMTQQCPKTCGRCGSGSVSSTTASSTTCIDQVNPRTGTSDCPSLVSYCTNSVYQSLMRTQCPKTCGFC